MTLQRYRAVVSYDGTHYAGWQVQPDKRTVQGELERYLQSLTGEIQRIHSSGRTDSGVHARAQVAHFNIVGDAIESRRLVRGFNALLDDDIRILSVKPVPNTFHARFSTVGKEYRYCIWNDEMVPPFLRLYRTHIRKPLNISAMNQAAEHLVGEHDFAAFTANPNREIDGTVRQIYTLQVSKHGHDITIVVKGNGFLYKMVRSLAGFLIRVGTGELTPIITKEILASQTRTARVPTAAAKGLFLWRVNYS